MTAEQQIHLAANAGSGPALLQSAGLNFVMAGGAVVLGVIAVYVLLGAYDLFAEWWERRKHKNET